MVNSARHTFPFLEVSQAQKELTHNEALRIIDVLANMLVIDRDLTAPPGSPVNGDTYIVAGSPTGAWVGQAGKIAFYYGGWSFITPFEGLTAWVDDEDRQIIYSDGSFRESIGSWNVTIGSSSSSNQTNLLSSDLGSIKPIDTGSSGTIAVLPPLTSVSSGGMIGVKKSNNNDNSTLVVHGYPNNLILHSNDQSNAAWVKSQVTITVDVGTDPNGGSTLDKIEEDTSNSLHEIAQVYAKPLGITQLVGQFVVQAVERDVVMLMLDRGSSANRAEMRVTLSTNTVSNTGSAGDATYVSGTCADLPNGNKLITIVANVTAAANNWSLRLRLFNGSSTYTGTLGSGVFAGRAQLGFYAPLAAYTETTSAAAIETIDGATVREIRSQGGTFTVFKGTSEWAGLRPESDVDSGTFTPSVSGASVSGSQTYGTRVGHWTRRGRWLDFVLSVQITTLDGTTAGNLRITGLPFASLNVSGLQQPVNLNVRSNLNLSGSYTQFCGFISNNSTLINIAEMGSGVAQQIVQASAAASGLTIDVQGSIRLN